MPKGVYKRKTESQTEKNLEECVASLKDAHEVIAEHEDTIDKLKRYIHYIIEEL